MINSSRGNLFHCSTFSMRRDLRLVVGCYVQNITPARRFHLPARYLNKFCRLPAGPMKRP